MVCRTAYLLREPELTKVESEQRYSWNQKTRKYDVWTEPTLIPYWSVTYTYDYGMCCGIDDSTDRFATEEEANKFISDLMDGKIKWIIVDKEFMEDYAKEDD